MILKKISNLHVRVGAGILSSEPVSVLVFKKIWFLEGSLSNLSPASMISHPPAKEQPPTPSYLLLSCVAIPLSEACYVALFAEEQAITK